ncbi:palmitoleoyl-protein carboxylesterase NOTUM isoform X3 [Equus asinus]|uniref:palmitoleoyl-protein carboxylesterase NOTUM isoform X3 n=1 Tax=Equus asinus TaxID=9793 RepID=UPI0038F73417
MLTQQLSRPLSDPVLCLTGNTARGAQPEEPAVCVRGECCNFPTPSSSLSLGTGEKDSAQGQRGPATQPAGRCTGKVRRWSRCTGLRGGHGVETKPAAVRSSTRSTGNQRRDRGLEAIGEGRTSREHEKRIQDPTPRPIHPSRRGRRGLAPHLSAPPGGPGAAAAGPSARSPVSAVALIPGAPLDKSPGRLRASARGGGSRAGRTSGLAQDKRRRGAGAAGPPAPAAVSAGLRARSGWGMPAGVRVARGLLWAWAARVRGTPAAQVSAAPLRHRPVGPGPAAGRAEFPRRGKASLLARRPSSRPGGGGGGAGLAAVNGTAGAAGPRCPPRSRAGSASGGRGGVVQAPPSGLRFGKKRRCLRQEKSERGPLPLRRARAAAAAAHLTRGHPGRRGPRKLRPGSAPAAHWRGWSQRTQTLRCPRSAALGARAAQADGAGPQEPRRRATRASSARPSAGSGESEQARPAPRGPAPPARRPPPAAAAASRPPALRRWPRARVARPWAEGCACCCCWACCTGPGAARARRPGGAAASSRPRRRPRRGPRRRRRPGSRWRASRWTSRPWRATWTASWRRSRAWRSPCTPARRSSSTRTYACTSCSTRR